MTNHERRTLAPQKLAVVIVLAAAMTTVTTLARAGGEIIPSIGITQSTDSHAGDAKAYGGLALRIPVLPFLKAEGGVSYRQDSFGDDLLGNDILKVRQWPVTVSGWVAPIPMIYAGGGVGWYHTTFDHNSDVLPIKDSTTDKVGVHLGGGLDLPIGPQVGLDLNGRYIFMQKDKDNIQVPQTFDPDYWTATVGLAIKF
jgi:hypothetical protein